MLENGFADDYVIATGESNSLLDFVQTTFSLLNLNWEDHVIIDNNLLRPTDLLYGSANPEKAHNVLGWKAKYKMNDVIEKMIEFELNNF